MILFRLDNRLECHQKQVVVTNLDDSTTKKNSSQNQILLPIVNLTLVKKRHCK